MRHGDAAYAVIEQQNQLEAVTKGEGLKVWAIFGQTSPNKLPSDRGHTCCGTKLTFRVSQDGFQRENLNQMQHSSCLTRIISCHHQADMNKY